MIVCAMFFSPFLLLQHFCLYYLVVSVCLLPSVLTFAVAEIRMTLVLLIVMLIKDWFALARLFICIATKKLHKNMKKL